MGLISPVNMIQLSPGRKPPYGTPLNRSHPLAQKLAGAFILNEGSGNLIYNAVTGRPETLIGATWAYGPSGPMLNFGTTSDYYYVNVADDVLNNLPLTLNFSVVVTQIPNYTPGVYGVCCWDGADDLILYPNDTTGIDGYRAVWRDCGTIDEENVNINLKDIYNVLAYTAKVGDQALYRNGVLIGTNNNSLSGAGPFANGLFLGIGRYDTPSYYFGGLVDYYLFFNQVLTQQEVQSLYIDPSAIYRPSMPYWFWSTTEVSISGTFAGDLDRLEGSLTETVEVSGTITGSLDRLTSELTGLVTVSGTLTGTLDKLTGDFSGEFIPTGQFAGALDRLVGELDGAVLVTGILAGNLDRLTGTLTGRTTVGGGRRGLYIELSIDL